MDRISNLSLVLCNRVFADGVDESLCSRGWRLRNVSWKARLAVALWPDHCRRSFMWHHYEKFRDATRQS